MSFNNHTGLLVALFRIQSVYLNLVLFLVETSLFGNMIYIHLTKLDNWTQSFPALSVSIVSTAGLMTRFTDYDHTRESFNPALKL